MSIGSRQDRRKVERVRADWTARLETASVSIEGHVSDLSTIGARIRPYAPAEAEVGEIGRAHV